jgi:4-hydroxy-tetrahydrodipicolinate reductase
MTKIIVCGIAGKMGTCIADLVRQTHGLQLTGGTEAPGSSAIDVLLPEGHPVVDDLTKNIDRCDVIIDFTSPESSLRNAEIASQHKKGIVMGTTGFNADEMTRLTHLLDKVPSVLSSNMSIGMNVLFKLVAATAAILGENYDVEILEWHHRQKKDAPSGSALSLAECVAKVLDRDLHKVVRYQRHGQIGPRKEKEIGIQAVRGGDIIGDHTVLFAGTGERLELTHRATSRENFARGAVLAAKWVKDKPAGIYTMQDVLNIK